MEQDAIFITTGSVSARSPLHYLAMITLIPAQQETVSGEAQSATTTLASWYTVLARLLVYVYAVNAFSFMYADPDLWGHLKFGEQIWSLGAIPATDSYSYTAPNHVWINHEWFSELLFYLIYSAAGSTGLLLFKLALGLTIVHILSELYFAKARNLLVYALHFILWTHVVALGFAMRPQLMTFLYLTLLVALFQKFFDGDRKVLRWAPLLMILWVNSHGGFVAGIGIFGMVTLIETVRCRRTGEAHWKPLLLWFGLSCAALFINPYGYKLIAFLLETIPRTRTVKEWEGMSLLGMDFIYFKAMVVLFALTLAMKQPKRYWELAIILFGIAYGFKHQRHTVLAAILLTPYIPVQWAYWLERRRAASPCAFPRWVHVTAMTGMLLFIAFQLNYHFYKFRKNDYSLQVDPGAFPVYAVRFLRDNDLNGNILVTSDWGEYVIWKLPRSKVSADGRYWTTYPPEVILQNLIFHEGWPGWQYYLDLYPHDIILTGNTNKDLEQVDGWVKVYQDPRARVFLRKTEPPSPALERFQKGEFIYKASMPSFQFP